jgi:parallel beta-helix repeat protein
MIKLLLILLFPLGLLAQQDINALINAAAPGSTLVLEEGVLYNTSTEVIINKPLTIEGNGATICWKGPSAKSVITVKGHDVRIKGLEVQAAYGAKIAGSYLVRVQGVSNTNRIRGFELDRSILTNYKDVALRLQYVDSFRITNNRIDSVPYSGIAIYSCARGLVEGNEITNITSFGAIRNEAYGITMSTLGSDSITRNIIVNKNILRNVLLWEGIDTHGGEWLTVSHNEVYNCNKGIAMVGGRTGAQKNISVTNNICDNTALGLKADCGIAIEGIPGPIFATGVTVSGNNCIGGGGGIKIQYTQGINVYGNTIQRTIGGFGIQLDAQNLSAKVFFNTFIDIMGTGNTAAIKTAGSGVNEVYVSGNSLAAGGALVPPGGNKNRYGYRANTTTQTMDKVRVDYNFFESATIAQYGNTQYVHFLCDSSKSKW